MQKLFAQYSALAGIEELLHEDVFMVIHFWVQVLVKAFIEFSL